MSELESFECTACDGEFRAYPGSNAASGEYCSPACEVEGKGLA